MSSARPSWKKWPSSSSRTRSPVAHHSPSTRSGPSGLAQVAGRRRWGTWRLAPEARRLVGRGPRCPGSGCAHRARLDIEADVVAADVARLGLAVAVGDLEPHASRYASQHVRARAARPPRSARRSAGIGRSSPLAGEHPVLGRRLAEDGHALALAQGEALARGRTARRRSAPRRPSARARRTRSAPTSTSRSRWCTQTRSSLLEPTQFSA